MPANPPENMPRITPNLFYDDLAAALEFLGKAFGFETRMSMPGPDGSIMHAEMELKDGLVMMGCPGPDLCYSGRGLTTVAVVTASSAHETSS